MALFESTLVGRAGGSAEMADEAAADSGEAHPQRERIARGGRSGQLDATAPPFVRDLDPCRPFLVTWKAAVAD